MSLLARIVAALERRLLGMSAEEIRYTFDDVRAELRAARAELKGEIAALRRDLDRLEGRPTTAAERDGRGGDEPFAEG